MVDFATLRVVGTGLVLSGLGIPDYSAHELTQTVEEAAGQGDFARTINNRLVDLSPPWLKLLKSTISCEDVNPPAFNGSPKGKIVTVDCIFEFAFLASLGSAGYMRDVATERTEGLWIYYKPRLVMMVTNFSLSKAEWPNTTSWTMELEEEGGDG
jgi:hypothetical protein